MNTTGLSRDNIVALVDCNNFYVSCERVFNPALLASSGCFIQTTVAGIRSQEIKT
jgi:DNA polymerase V